MKNNESNNMNVMLSIGDIVIDNKSNKKHRIVAIVNNEITLCEMEITSLSLSLLDKKTLFSLILTEDIIVQKEESFVFDKNKLPDEAKEKFEIKQKIMTEILKIYGPQYIELAGKKPKNEIKEVLAKYNFPKSSFWRICVSYFQSGMQDYSLVDSRYLGVNKGKTYNYDIIGIGVII